MQVKSYFSDDSGTVFRLDQHLLYIFRPILTMIGATKFRTTVKPPSIHSEIEQIK